MLTFPFNKNYTDFQSMLVTKVYTIGCISEIPILSSNSIFTKKGNAG